MTSASNETALEQTAERRTAPSSEDAVVPGALVVRRSIFINATPERIWREVDSHERFAAWWGVDTDVLKTRILRWEPRIGGWFENQGTHSGVPINFSGRIVAFDPPRELTFEWMAPGHGWTESTFVTIRLTPQGAGTVVEILHHGWERLGGRAAEMHRGFESGWSLVELEALRTIVESDPD
jgi:uncharacterized protein YndB with AHSA1/START domain